LIGGEVIDQEHEERLNFHAMSDDARHPLRKPEERAPSTRRNHTRGAWRLRDPLTRHARSVI